MRHRPPPDDVARGPARHDAWELLGNGVDQRPPMSTAAQLWTENQDLAARAVEHPFLRSLADGTLPADTFAGYVAQDAYFLESFARGYALAVAHSTDRPTLEAFARLLAGVLDELRLHDGYAAELRIDRSAVQPWQATRAYCDFLLATAALRSVGLTCAAMTPCMRLYAHLGNTLAATATSTTYAAWIATYADPTFEDLAVTLEELLDVHADDPGISIAYRHAMKLELAFFDAALEA